MITSKHISVSSIGSVVAAALVALLIGACHPNPPPPPPPPVPVATTTYQATPQPVAQPTYRPTTEEWVPLPLKVLYPSGGSRLDDQGRALLRELHASASARTDIVRIAVEGHTDGRGAEANNDQLAVDRAQGVVDFAVGDLGMPRELFEVHGFGDDVPITSDTTAADRVQNRRVEFKILVRRQAAPK